jgi:glutathione peroxidase
MNITKIKGLIQILMIMIMMGAITMMNAKTAYDFSVERIDGSLGSLEDYRGKVILIVNTASKCGFTKQYDGLQKLYEDYQDAGLVVLGFPANNFMNQEPGTNEDIAEFCRLNFGVSFPMFAKVSVKGKDIHPLFDWLTSKDSNPEFAGNVSWNFNKFLISKDGLLINRFGSRTEPQDPELITAIEAALK